MVGLTCLQCSNPMPEIGVACVQCMEEDHYSGNCFGGRFEDILSGEIRSKHEDRTVRINA